MTRRLAGWGLCVLALAALAMPWRAWAHGLSADLGRVARVIAPDGAETVTGYDGAIVTVTDPAGAMRQTTSDALGRIVEVVEAPGAQGYLTNYAYDARGNLKQVTQGSQTRTFAYDTLSRLVSAANPESGMTCYGEMVSGLCQARYDGNGNLLKKTDARGIVTTMSYDALNRATSKSFSNGDSAVSFAYDTNQAIAGVSTENRPVGRLVSVSNAAGATVYRWDGMGRPLASRQTPAGSASYVFEYAYKPAGLASMKYPSGRLISTSYDEAGRTNAVTGLKDGNATNYLTGATYAPHGGLAEFQFGGAKTEQICYNNRMQPVGIRVGANPAAGCAGAGGDLLHLTLGYGAANNNGNVLTQLIQAPGGTFAQTFKYDELNRLCTAREAPTTSPWGPHACGDMQGLFGGEAWRQTFGFDRFGNQWVAQHLGANMPYSGLRPTQQSNINAANNRLADVVNQIAFDAAGYQTRHGGWTLVHDAEGRIKTATPSSGSAASYEYDGEARRVKKTVGSTSTWYVYNAMGELAAEYQATAPTGAAATHYVTTDHLGSTRLVTDGSGNVVSRHDYLPFGEEIPAGMGGRTAGMGYVANPALTQRFTGKERDAETGLDYSVARYFSSAQGRFTSPDAPFADQDIAYPQSWNLYSYVRNNPLRSIDPSGRKCVETSNGPADDGAGGGCAAAGVSENGTITPQRVTVSVGRNEANLIMLQGIGQGLNSPHQIATIVSEAGQGAMMVSSVRGLPSLWRGLRAWWVGEELIQLGIASSNGGVLAGAKFAQTTASAMFSSTGKFAGRSVDEVANALRSGTLHPGDVPIEYAVRDGNTLILNTRSAMALEKAGIPRSNWNAINVTNDAAAQARLSGQLERNGLTSAGADSVRVK